VNFAKDLQKETLMARIIEGGLHAKGLKFVAVVSRFNDFFSERLLTGCIDCLVRHGADEASIEVVRVPGSWEIPPVAQKLAASGKYNAVICLGVIVRGGTPHFDFIAREASKGIAEVAMKTGVPVSFGIITADTLEQAVERAGTKHGNKGWDAALTAIELANLYKSI
jgi:6,7-dimethyl-8-ribityllumazine synthase